MLSSDETLTALLNHLREAEFEIWLNAFWGAADNSVDKDRAGDRMAVLAWEGVPIPAEHDTQNLSLFDEGAENRC